VLSNFSANGAALNAKMVNPNLCNYYLTFIYFSFKILISSIISTLTIPIAIRQYFCFIALLF
jgi:hypothetical protein